MFLCNYTTEYNSNPVVLYLKHIAYPIEIKDKNSSNIFLMTVNENLYFKI